MIVSLFIILNNNIYVKPLLLLSIFLFIMETKLNINPIKVVSLQMPPIHKDVLGSMRKADTILSEVTDKDNVDILVLSEMVFTGYKFTNV